MGRGPPEPEPEPKPDTGADNLALICFGTGGLVLALALTLGFRFGLVLAEFAFSFSAICLASSEDLSICDFPPVGLVDGSMAAQAVSFSALKLAACFDFDDVLVVVSGLLFLEAFALALALVFPFFLEEMDSLSLSLSLSLSSLPVAVAVSPLVVLVALRTAGVIVTPALPLVSLVVPVQVLPDSGDEFLGVENFSDMRKEAQS